MRHFLRNFGENCIDIIDHISDGFWGWDINEGKIYLSKSLKRILGYEEDELQSQMTSWEAIIHHDDLEKFLKATTEYLKRKSEDYELEYRMKTKLDEDLWVRVRGYALFDEKNHPVQMIGACTNIHELKITQEALKENDLINKLRENEEKYRRIVENSPNAEFMHDKGYFVFANEAGVRLLGESRKEDVIGKSIYEYIHPGNHKIAAERIYHAQHNNMVAPLMRQKIITVDKKILDVEVVTTSMDYLGRNIALTIIRDISEKVEIEKALKESEERYDKLVDLSPDAIFLNDEEKILYSNDAGVKLLGCTSKDEVEGQSFTKFLSDSRLRDLGTTRQYLGNPLNDKIRLDTEIRQKNGQIIDAESIVLKINYQGKKMFLTIMRDISERKKAELALKAIADLNTHLLNKAIEYDKIKTEFFSNISHELRTPLNIILGVVQLFQYSHSEEEKQCKSYNSLEKRMGLIKQNCYRLLKIVNNLIDLTAIDSGYLKISLENHNIISFIEDIVQSVSEYALNKGIEIIFDTDLEERITAYDADKIERIMLNLLSNAVKFTPPNGTIEVNIENDKDHLVIIVKDNGEGIPQEKLDIIFDRFRQADSSLTRKNEGSGIGLSLVKTLVEAHQGEVFVKSELGKGSQFIVKIPCKLVDEVNTIQSNWVGQSNVERINIEFSDIYITE